MMLNALERGRGYFHAHPETQRFYGREAELRHMHDFVVLEMKTRGYNHRTPVEGERVPCLHKSSRWRVQDIADLYRKWTAEDRWDDQGHFEAGMMRMLKDPETGDRVRMGFHPPRDPELHPDRDYMRAVAAGCPPRHWTKSHTERLRRAMETRPWRYEENPDDAFWALFDDLDGQMPVVPPPS